MDELGPFRVNSDGKTLFRNDYAWNSGKQILVISPSNDRVGCRALLNTENLI